MSQKRVRFFALVFVVFAFAAQAVAHHAFATEFDATKRVTIRGYVTKIEWTNPHAWFYLNVKNEQGVIENWGFEMGSPNALYNAGWTRTSLKIGEEIIVEGSLARDGRKRVNSRNVTIVASGKKFGTASSENNQEQ
jgi:hypothetical protein